MATEIFKNMIPTLAEIRKIFRDNNLNLDFPIGVSDGGTITDWQLHNKVIDMCDSNLLKFINIIKLKYSDKYYTKASGYSSSIDVYKVV